MRSFVVAGIAVVVVIALFLVGIFALPGAALAGFCVMPFAFFAFGWTMARAGLSFQSPIRSVDASPVKQRRTGSQI